MATSDGDLTIDTDDFWFATASSAGGPVTVHLFRNKHGIQPSTAGIVAGDNLQLEYPLSVGPGETVRLAHFTVMGNDLAAATAAANVLLGSSTALGGEAGAFLTQSEIDSFANFAFHVPEVLDITLAGTNWASDFIDAVDGGGSGAGNGLGHSLVGTHQLETTPWAGADKLYVKFSTDVSSSLDAGDFTLLGTNGGTYAFILLPYGQDGTNVATILLDQAIDIDSLVLSIDAAGVQNATGDLLDGEWTSGQAVSSGDGTAGGQFDFFFNVLPGDVDASDQVTVTDAFLAFASDTAATTELLARKDIDASGQITATDAFAVFAKNTFGLPAQPVPPAPTLAVLQASVVIDEALDQLANAKQLASQELEEADEDFGLAFPISLRGAYTPTARGRIAQVGSSRIAYSSSEQESNASALATLRVTGQDDLDRNVSSYDEALSEFDSDEETAAVTVASSRSRSFAPAIRSRFSRT